MRLKQLVSKYRFSEDTLHPYPAFPLLYFFLATSLPLGMLDFGYVGNAWAAITAVTLVLVGIFVFPGSHRNRVWTAVLGALVTWLHIWAPWRSYERYLPRPEVYAEVEAIITDDHMLSDDSLRDLTKNKNIEINIVRLRLSQHEDWHRSRGRILLLKPAENFDHEMTVVAKGALI